MTYSIAVRSGGTHDCRWTRISDVYASRAEADVVIERERLAGRKAIAFVTDRLNTIGLPIGWKPSSINWNTDIVTNCPNKTRHIKTTYAG